jgi:hypothetical protein
MAILMASGSCAIIAGCAVRVRPGGIQIVLRV